MSEQNTRNLSEGRYVYDVNVKTGTNVSKLVNGNILVYAGISTTP